MTKPILYFAHWCPDTAPFVAELQRLGVDYEAVDITASGANFKPFLRLRDRHKAFDNAKVNGYIGIPALLLEDDRVVLDLAELKGIFG
ncbi:MULTISPECIES: hypothetical protein [Glaesserella]|uniref:Glutaredoxin n=1 Tax=Glaesserella australis TaxID=2094024 RepID=A0A328BYZ5_9PAST|nr:MULTISPECIES: hypothetical protein [Glaesserella]AUI67046.1 hypothetical protein CJD39_10940 [Glaesserella sp. 15-184]RAL18861.1 hypothetical protein C5N92_05710 [Glaesserella australis]